MGTPLWGDTFLKFKNVNNTGFSDGSDITPIIRGYIRI